MGGNVSRMVGCFAPPDHHDKVGVFLSEPFDGGLGHSFCYVRPISAPSPPHCDSDGGPANLGSEGSRTSLIYASGSGTCAHDHQPMRFSLETSFKAISGASVSANPSTPHTITSLEQFCSFANVSYDRAAAFEASASFNSLPLQPVPRGLSQSGPITGSSSGQALDRGFLSGPIERGFLSGPLERALLSGPLERDCVSAPIEATDRSFFSAPLTSSYHAAYFRRQRRSLAHLVKNLGYPVRKALYRSLSKTSLSLLKTQRSLAAPVRLLWSLGKDPARDVCSRDHDCALDLGYTSSSSESHENHNLQWAQGKAGEDRMHVVLSDEHGWLFVGIYDGFSGPDAPDFLLSNLYKEVYKELKGLLWDNREVLSVNNVEASNSGALSKDECTEQMSHDSNVCQKSEQGFSFPASKGQNKAYMGPAHDVQRVQANNSLYLAGNYSINCSHTCMVDIFDGNIGDGRPDGEGCTRDSDHGCRNSIDSSNQFKVRNCTSQQQRDCEVDTDKIKLPSVPGKGSSAFLGKHRKIWFGRALSDLRSKKSSREKKGKHKLCTHSYGLEQDLKGRQKKFEEMQPLDSGRLNKSKDVDHSGVLRALSNALESTERMFLEMADDSMKEMPEILLMGSCVLVMLMKGEDVYVMNVGDSRAILAQAKNDIKSYPSNAREPASSQALESESHGLQDTQQRQELGCIIEETPSELGTLRSSQTCSSAGPAAVSLFLRALQLTADHSTNVEEEVIRIQSEHLDDEKSVINERVKGQLKVTRAFGAGFLKSPRWNNALLEMFRVNYVGTAPYVTCVPAVHHHCLGPNDRFLVLSSDGLYQYLSNDEVVSQVEWFMENFPDGDPAQYLIEELLFRAAKKAGMDFHELLEIPQGDRRKYHDDVSVMVISLEGRKWHSFG